MLLLISRRILNRFLTVGAHNIATRTLPDYVNINRPLRYCMHGLIISVGLRTEVYAVVRQVPPGHTSSLYVFTTSD